MTALVIWSFVKRFWPVAVGALLVIGVLLWGNSREAAGVRKERQAGEVEAARLRAVAAQEALQRLEAVNVANTAAAASRAALDALAAQTKEQSDAYYRANPARNVPCLSDDRLRAIEKADRAAIEAARAAR